MPRNIKNAYAKGTRSLTGAPGQGYWQNKGVYDIHVTVHADTRSGQLIYTNAYYYIGHFSKFIKPGAKRVIASPSRSQLLATAFLNEDGEAVTVVMNQSDKSTKYLIWVNGKAADLTAPGHSIQTLIF